MTHTFTRPRMTAAELAEHQLGSYGRDYSESDDGYGDMEVESRRGWHVLSSWGRDGWDLGQHPYVVLYTQDIEPRPHGFHDQQGNWIPQAPVAVEKPYALMSICEGDRTVYTFASEADRSAALDYLFLWYAAGERWAPLTWEDRAALDAGELEVDDKFRGPYRRTVA